MKKTQKPATALAKLKAELTACQLECKRRAIDRDAARDAAKMVHTRAEKAEGERAKLATRICQLEKEHKTQLNRNDILYEFVRDGGMNVRTIINDVLSPAEIKASVIAALRDVGLAPPLPHSAAELNKMLWTLKEKHAREARAFARPAKAKKTK